MKKEYTYEVGDVVTMKKPHPCGSKEWEILRVGADFRLKWEYLLNPEHIYINRGKL